jgi:TP901 family phage tail tape measure protein
LVDQNINTNITATANFGSLTAQLQAVTSELIKLQTTTLGLNQKLNAQIGQMNRSFVDTMRSTGQFSSHFVTLSSDVDKFGKNLASGRMKLSEYYNTWQSHAKKTSTIVKDLAKQQVMLQNSVVQPLGKNAQGLMQYNVMVARGLDENANKMQLLRQEQAIMNRVMQDGSNQLINWGKNTQWAGRQLTVGLTVPLAAFGAAASRAFLTADAELVRLTKVYGGLTQTSAADLAKIRKDISATAKELAVQYGASYKDSIALAADLAATGLQGNALVSATKETTRLAVLGEVDRQDAMKATLAIQNAFKQSTEELTQSIDFLNAVENQTSTSLGDLVEAIPKAGPVIKSLGGDVKDLALYLTAMKEGGVNASEGANAIKSAMASLINPTKVAKEMFTGFGIDLAGIVSSNAGDLTGTILSLQKALDSLDPLSKSKAIEQLFGKFQFARMSALFENLGKQGSQTLQVLDLMKASTQDLANISAREMKQMTESASGQYKRALESVKADMAAAGESFLKISTFVLKAIDGIVKFITDLPGPIKSILTFVGGLTALAGPLIMLTGVLGNFFGYIVKGIFNLKQLFKGGSAFKLLTPEIMAAEAAAKAVGESFYSDAKAAKVFEDAVLGLARSFEILQTKAAMATRATHSSVSMSTVGGGVVTTGSGFDRVVNKDSQYLGKPYSRDMSHTIPSGEEQLGTIFGVVPGTGPVNRKISNNPQMYMDGDLPRVPGVTSVNSVSTGIVASEAAKWHSMTAALAMQSKEELAILKQEVSATGTITAELSASYSAMLPPMVELTTMAAAEGAAIVAELQAGKLTVDQARAKIIALNQTVEAMMAETAQMTAATMGRTVNLTTVPLTSQPTVDPVTGKSNMKEMFHKGATKTLVDRIARSLGVRTSGGGYSTETTLPIVKRNDGGMVYDPSRHGSVVPGPANVNYDIIPAKLPEGSYILNQQASRNNPDLVSMAQNKYSGGGKVVDALLTPRETYFDPEFTAANKPLLDKANSGSRIELRNTGGMLGGLVTRGIRNYGNIAIDSTDPVVDFIKYYSGSDRADLRIATIAADASTLTSLGLPAQDAITEASKWFDDRWRETLSLNDGTFSQDIFNQITTDDLPNFEKRLRKQEKYKGKLHKKRLSMPVKNRTRGGTASLTRKDWQYVGPTSAYEKIAARNEVLEAMAGSSTFEKEKVTNLIKIANRFGDGPNNGVQVAHFTPGSSPSTPVAGIDHLGRAALQPWEINQIQDSLSAYGIFSSDFSLDPAENIAMLDGAASEHGYADHKDMLNKILNKDSSPATKKTMRTSRGLTTTMQAVIDRKPKDFKAWLASRAMRMSKFAKRNLGGMVGGLVKSGKYGYGNESPAALRLKAFAAAQQVRRDAEHKKNLEKYPWIKPQIDAYRASQKDPLFLGMPRGIKAVEAQRKARLTMEEIDSSLRTSQFATMDPTDFGVLKKASSGHSFPVDGIAGVYQKPDGSIVFVKPVMSETEALAEQRATTIARGGHGLASPTQEIRTMIDPTDPAKKRRVIVLESKYDSIFDQANNGVFSQEEYFKQIVAANLRGDRDLSRDNLQGGILNDVGTSGVFKMASSAQGKREYFGEMVDGVWVDGMPSMKEQARINLLGVKGGAKKFFAESTLDIPKGMTAAQYHQAMIDEIDSVLPNLRNVIAGMNLTAKERQIYGAMIKRLEEGRLVNWEEFHGIHSAVKPSAPKALTPAALLKLKTEAELRMRQRGHAVSLSDNSFKNDANGFNIGGMVQAREKGGPVNSGQPYLVGERGPELFVPKNNGGIVSNYALGGMVRSNKFGYGDKFIGPQPYGVRSAFSAGVRGINTGSGKPMDPNSGMGASMAGMGLMMGGQGVGGTAGSAMTNVGMAMQMYPLLKMMGPQIQGLTKMSGVITKLGVIGPRAFNAIGLAIKFMTGPIGLFMIAATGVYTLLKKIMEENAQDAKQFTLINAMTATGAKEAGIRYNNLSDSIKRVNEQLATTKAKGLAAYESLTKIGVIGITYTIKEQKEAIKNAKTNQKSLVEGFTNAGSGLVVGGSDEAERLQIVTEMATNLKIQMVLSGKSVQDATNQIYAIISASKHADLAFKAITAEGFVRVKDKTTAATESIERLNKALTETEIRNGAANTLVGNDLGVALSNTTLYLESNMNALIGTKDAQNNVIDSAKAYEIIMKQINEAAGANTKLTQMQVDSLKESHPALEAILNKSDDIGSVLAKWQLALGGFDINLKGITGDEAIAIAKFQAIQQAALDAQEESGKGVLGRSQKIITKLQDSIGKNLAAAQKAHSKQMSNAQDEIKAIDKKIAKINEEAEARKRALQDVEDVESNALQLQLLQIDYQSALATGDMEAAASAQIKVTQLQKQIQTAAALQAIEDKRIADVKKEEARKQKVQDEVEKNAKRLAALQEEATKNQIRLSKVQEYQLRYEALIKDKMRMQVETDPVKYAELEKAYIGNVKLLGANLSADAKGKDSSLSSMLKDIFSGSMISDSGESLATVKTSLTYNPGVGPVSTTKYGAAFDALNLASKETEKTIKGLGGGKTLFDVYNAILTGHRSAATALMVQGNYSTEDKNGDKGVLTKQGKEFAAQDNAITPGEYFKYNGWTYRMLGNGEIRRGNRYQSGGHITGPGTGTSDSIPAYLSNGEYVVRASSVAKYGVDTFDALNAQKLHKGGPVGHKHGPAEAARLARLSANKAVPQMSSYNPDSKIAIANNQATNAWYKANDYYKDYRGEWVKRGPSQFEKYTTAANWKNFLNFTASSGPISDDVTSKYLTLMFGANASKMNSTGKDFKKGEWANGIFNVLTAGLVGSGATAVGRAAIEQVGISKGIPGLGSLLPKGSFPYMGKAVPKFLSNLGTAGAIGLAKPFVANKISSLVPDSGPKIKITSQVEARKDDYPPFVEHEGQNVAIHKNMLPLSRPAVFQGHLEDLSSLKGYVDIIGTKPDEILSYILKHQPNNKKAKRILDKINSQKWDDPEVKNFLLDMAATNNLSPHSVTPTMINTTSSGTHALAQLIRAMGGNVDAAVSVKARRQEMKPVLTHVVDDYLEHIEDIRAVREAYDARHGGPRGGMNGMRGEPVKTRSERAALEAGGWGTAYKPTSPDDIAMIRVFNDDPPVLNNKGQLSESPAADFIWKRWFATNSPVLGEGETLQDLYNARMTRHLTVGDAVASHWQGTWKPNKPFIVSTLSNLMKYNKKPEQLHSRDSYWLTEFGKRFIYSKKEGKLSSGFPLEEEAYIKKLTELGQYREGQSLPLLAEDTVGKNVYFLDKPQYSQKELQDIANQFSETPNLRTLELRSNENGGSDFVMPRKNEYEADYTMDASRALQIMAIEKAKKQIGIDQPYQFHYSGGAHESIHADQLEEVAYRLGVKTSGIHSGTDIDNLANTSGGYNMFGDLLNPARLQQDIPNDGVSTATKALSTILMNIRFGKLNSGKVYPNEADKAAMLEYQLQFGIRSQLDRIMADRAAGRTPIANRFPPKKSTGAATGGYVSGGNLMVPKFADGGYINPSYSANMSIPKFENGINMVPADMLAMIHKNEAVIPANMNPFNPNANAYDIKSGSEYNINVTLNGSNLSPDDVAKAISREMQLRDAMQGRSRNR